jgi:hypothetical protein
MKYLLSATLIMCSLGAMAAAQEQTNPPLQPSLDIHQYDAELDRWSDLAKSLEQHPEQAAALRNTLPGAWRVNIRGEQYSASTEWLRSTLSSLQVNHWLAGDYAREIRMRLAVMRDEAQALEEPSGLGPGVARNKLDDILRRREFSEVQGPTWLDRLRERIAYWLDELLEKLFGSLGGNPTVGNILMWSLVAGLASLLIIMLMRHFLKGSGGALEDRVAPGPASRSWKDWSKEALAAASLGDYREAIRLSYWAGVFRMEELGVWRVDRARTHREYLRLIPSSDMHRNPLTAITNRFELVWYGGAPASAEDFESVLTQLERLGCRLRLHQATANS